MEKRAWSWLQSGLAETLSPTWHVWQQVHLIWDQRLDCSWGRALHRWVRPQYYLGGMESTAESYSGTKSGCKRGLYWAKPTHLMIWPWLLCPLLLAPLILPSAAATGAASWFSLKGPSPGRGPLSRTRPPPLFLALYSQAWQPCLPAGFSSKVSPCEKPPLCAPGHCPLPAVLLAHPRGLLCVPFSPLLTHHHHLVFNIGGRDPVGLWPAGPSVSGHSAVERLQRKSRCSSPICYCRRMNAFELWCWEKTLESPLGCKEIQPVHPKGNQY